MEPDALSESLDPTEEISGSVGFQPAPDAHQESGSVRSSAEPPGSAGFQPAPAEETVSAGSCVPEAPGSAGVPPAPDAHQKAGWKPALPGEPEQIFDAAALAPEQQLAADEVTVPQVSTTNAAPLVEGSLWRAIWTMSWPLILTTIGTSIGGMVDVQVAGMVGSSAQAAVGLSEQILFLFMVFLMSLGVGTTAIVSRVYGEGKRDEAHYAAGQSLSLSVLVGIVLTALALLIAKYLAPWFTSAPAVVAQTYVYLNIMSFYLVPFSVVCVANAAFRAIGDAKTTLIVVTTEVVITVAGDYLTVAGQWPVPGLGICGIAYSATLGAIVAAFLSIFFISRSPIRQSLKHLVPVSKTAVLRVLKVGLPAALQRVSWAASVFVVFFVLAKLPSPTAALASWTVGMRVEAILFMPLMALSLAVGSIVGQNLGAGQIDRAFKAGWTVTNIGIGMMLLLAGALFAFANPLAVLMSHDPKTIEYTASYLRINALAEPILAVNMILSGALQGAGDTKITMWVSIFSNWVVRLPLVWLLALPLNWGANGVWVAMDLSIVVSAVIIAWRFQSGAWVKQKV